MKTIAISGYKAHELGIFDQKHKGIYYIKKAIETRIRPLIDEGLEWVIISGQLGVELWAAEVIFQLKQEFPQLQLAILTPFLNQEERWQDATKTYYQEIINQADFVDSITKRPYDNPLQLKQKNEFIIAKADGLMLLYDEEKPGSPTYYLEVAKKRQMHDEFQVIFITPTDLDLLVQEEQYNQFESEGDS
ncbi:hypothetical protein JCM9140_1093 [Halalkalibacter wakoensis JCM 9140]|uniref:UPF0398 protein JCM9140_1093 n=1 Tax=Halalkalibacter wakoensis JCM 9140 TaxID=1236970 RepID=W4PZK8_9BACI|nr:DUF1273 domain-containing protein [Halalkalibacter wakoensis]GAE25120.1 hypothetical protein JCM9140_1093 [Halalkalibacter wakoensis JCM 9140]